MSSVFLDTSFFIALYNKDDEYHEKAVSILTDIKGCRFVLTQAIILEIGNAFSDSCFKKTGIKILRELETNSSKYEIVDYDQKIHRQAFQLFESRIDKDWSLTDCISFAAMKNLRLNQALTTDRHFIQAGFESLLL